MKKQESFEDAIPKPQTFYYKLWRAKQAIGKVAKNAKNPHFKNNYADINALINEVEPVLLEHNLLLLQPIIDGCVRTLIIDAETGESIKSEMKLPEIQDPQKIGSAVTYYRRYTLQSVLSLQAIDDDGNIASEAIKQPKQQLSNERFIKALEALQNGNITKLQLISDFDLTKEQLEKLNIL